jgi:hypothetical protein
MRPSTDGTLRPGDWVQIKSPNEIAETLDENGMLENLPFMPEMLELCGQNAVLARRAEKTCIEFPGGGYKIREFLNNNTFVLEGLRCSGQGHDGCQRGCTLFWKRSWLRKVHSPEAAAPDSFAGKEELRKKLKTKASSIRYVCQSTELARATKPLTRPRVLLKCLYDLRSRSRGVMELSRLVLIPAWRKATRRIRRGRLTGRLKHTPVEKLQLQPGEWVTIKSQSEIVKTLDNYGRNRGLIFDEGMGDHGEKKFCVRQRLDRMISEPTGEMRHMDSTVILEDLKCTCTNVLGGCPRQDFTYWREIWLQRVDKTKPVSCSHEEREHCKEGR